LALATTAPEESDTIPVRVANIHCDHAVALMPIRIRTAIADKCEIDFFDMDPLFEATASQLEAYTNLQPGT
jgi:hypothetical protein